MKRVLKSFLSWIIVSVLCITNVYAYQDENYYVERGQVNLEFLNITKDDDNNIIVEEKTKQSNGEKEKLLVLLENETIKNEFIYMLENNELPAVYGYAKYELKEVEDGEGNIHLEPMSIFEKNTRDVPQNDNYQLTLTLSVNNHDSGGKRYIGTTLKIVWEYPNGAVPEFRVERTKPDYVSMTYPSPYIIETNADAGISGVADNPVLEDIEDYGLVGSFYEDVGTTYMGASSVVNIPTSKERRFTAQYVHTYSTKKPSFSISLKDGTVTFNGVTESNDMWKLAVYVDYTC